MTETPETTSGPAARATHEVYASAHEGQFCGTCRICRYTTRPGTEAATTTKIEAHVEATHGANPAAAR